MPATQTAPKTKTSRSTAWVIPPWNTSTGGRMGVLTIRVGKVHDYYRVVWLEQDDMAVLLRDARLDMSNSHKCETTHCRAGWVVHLAGKAGYDLERKTSPVFAAMQIYKASGHPISPCRFFDSGKDAMADIHKCASPP